MLKTWRPLALAVAFTVTLTAGVASAQTVIVRHAKAGSTAELVLNTTTSATGTVDAAGDATLKGDIQAVLGKTETDAYAYVDICGTLVRVHLVERGVQPPPPGADCTQQPVGGLFWLRQISSVVLDVGGPSLTMRLKQGPAPAQWLVDAADGPAVRRSAPTGLVLFGSGGFSTFSNVINLACGDAPTCGNRDTGVAYSGGVTYWFTPYLAVEGSYLKPAKATADGGGTGYRFNSELDTHVLNLGGNVGVPIGPVRLYGKIAATYHRASFETTETIDDSTVTIDDVPQTIEGGTQSYDLRTGGWGWMFGGGLEAWATPTFAFYAEGGRAVIKGDHLDEGEGAMDDRLLYVLVGARFRIGR